LITATILDDIATQPRYAEAPTPLTGPRQLSIDAAMPHAIIHALYCGLQLLMSEPHRHFGARERREAMKRGHSSLRRGVSDTRHFEPL
jgi:hypothetical protein